MRFTDATEALEEPLVLPLRGANKKLKDYKIEPVDAADGIKLQELMTDIQALARRQQAGQEVTEADAAKLGDKDSLAELEEKSLGREVRDQMIRDGVKLRSIQVAGMTAFYWQTLQDEGATAEAYWKSGGKAPKPNRAQRRTATRTQQGAATTTKKRASATGTKPKAGASKTKA
ncbi:hypothetical protein [Brevibacterium aurantiacum]|uniref:DUF7426 domain-containing protein n=1 Tax=Brevibacterium aurantiacum TaxID=273384 RepID=A0A556C3H5_BREAU|nr:hypothetical protein [Brevibacterium aurantiacum]TSI11972.1 hypothetical protein FO013_21250 [Brevibacterium aurantiacum]